MSLLWISREEKSKVNNKNIKMTSSTSFWSVEICLGLRQETKTFIFDEFSLLFFAEASSDHTKLKFLYNI